jgi:hypothetical protein
VSYRIRRGTDRGTPGDFPASGWMVVIVVRCKEGGIEVCTRLRIVMHL